MQQIDLQTEMSSLQNQLDLLTREFDYALAQDVKLVDTKKIFREIRSLQERINELNKKNSNTQ